VGRVPRLALLGQISEIWACLQLVGVKKLWLFFLHRKSFLSTKILLFHFFRQRLCKIFVINAIVDRHPRSYVGKIWWMRGSTKFFCVFTGNSCTVNQMWLESKFVFFWPLNKQFGPLLAILARLGFSLKFLSGNPVYEQVNVLRTRYDRYQTKAKP